MRVSHNRRMPFGGRSPPGKALMFTPIYGKIRQKEKRITIPFKGDL
jgi:hypothetical protein